MPNPTFHTGALFSFDLSVDPSTYGLDGSGKANSIQWINSGNEVLSRPSGSLTTISPIDTTDGGCRSLEAFKKTYGSTTEYPRCFVKMHAEYTNSLVYIEFLQYRYADLRISVDSTRILILDPATKASVTHFKVTKPKTGTRQLWGVVSTVANGVVFFTSNGAYSSPSSGGIAVSVSALAAYNTLVTTSGEYLNCRDALLATLPPFISLGLFTKFYISFPKLTHSLTHSHTTPLPTPGTSVLSGALIPGTSLLMLLLDQKGVQSMVTYDTAADSYISNKGPAAPTHVMLAYTYGVCDGAVTKGLVELTFSNDYSSKCQLPSTGLYYQSENRYFAIPYSCLGIAYDKLLTDCAGR